MVPVVEPPSPPLAPPLLPDAPVRLTVSDVVPEGTVNVCVAPVNVKFAVPCCAVTVTGDEVTPDEFPMELVATTVNV